MICIGLIGYTYTKRVKKRIVEKVADQIRPESEQYDDVLHPDLYGDGKNIDNDYDIVNANEEEEVRYAEAYQMADQVQSRYCRADVCASEIYPPDSVLQPSGDDYWQLPATEYIELYKQNPQPMPRKMLY